MGEPVAQPRYVGRSATRRVRSLPRSAAGGAVTRPRDAVLGFGCMAGRLARSPAVCRAAFDGMSGADQFGEAMVAVESVTRAPRQCLIGGRVAGSDDRHPEVRIREC